MLVGERTRQFGDLLAVAGGKHRELHREPLLHIGVRLAEIGDALLKYLERIAEPALIAIVIGLLRVGHDLGDQLLEAIGILPGGISAVVRIDHRIAEALQNPIAARRERLARIEIDGLRDLLGVARRAIRAGGLSQ